MAGDTSAGRQRQELHVPTGDLQRSPAPDGPSGRVARQACDGNLEVGWRVLDEVVQEGLDPTDGRSGRIARVDDQDANEITRVRRSFQPWLGGRGR